MYIESQFELLNQKLFSSPNFTKWYSYDQSMNKRIEMNLNSKRKSHRPNLIDNILNTKTPKDRLPRNKSRSMIPVNVENFMFSDWVNELNWNEERREINRVPTWRICYGPEDKDFGNPLFNPWLWRGSVRYAHFKWMKKWINSRKKVISSMHCLSYYWKISKWEIWQTNLITDFIYNDNPFYLLDYEVPRKGNDYLILEQINCSSIKMVHIVDIDWRDKDMYRKHMVSFKIGSNTQNDIWVFDKSVDRSHAEITWVNGWFYLRDLDSKRGTFFLNQIPVVFNEFSAKEKIFYFPNHLIKMKLMAKSKSGCLWWLKRKPRKVGNNDNDIPIKLSKFLQKKETKSLNIEVSEAKSIDRILSSDDDCNLENANKQMKMNCKLFFCL